MTFPAGANAIKGGEISSTKKADEVKNPVIAGNRMDRPQISNSIIIGAKNGTGGFQGDNNSQTIILLSNEILPNNNNDLNEKVGLQIMDPKRRRIEEPKDSGLVEENVATDIDMTGEEQIVCLNPKNLPAHHHENVKLELPRGGPPLKYSVPYGPSPY